MALLVLDSCDNEYAKLHYRQGSVSYISNGGVYGGGALKVNNSTTAYVNQLVYRWATPTSGPKTYRFSFWFRTEGLATSYSYIPIFQYYMTNANYGYFMAGAGDIYLLQQTNDFTRDRYGAGTSVQPLNLFDGKWHHLHYAVKYTDVGTVQIRVDDRLTYSSTNVDMIYSLYGSQANGATTFTFFNFTSSQTNATYYVDDVVLWDSDEVGDGFGDNYVPPARIFTLRPSADTAQAQSTPSTGTTRYDILASANNYGMNGYITLNPGKSDVYELDNLPANANIRAVAINLNYATEVPGAYANVRVTASSNNVNIYGNTFSTMSLGYNNPVTDFSWKPAAYLSVRDFGSSNAFWTQGSVANLQIGIENTGAP